MVQVRVWSTYYLSRTRTRTLLVVVCVILKEHFNMYHWSMNDPIIATSSNYSNTLPVANEKKIELHETNEGIYTSD